jgi:soluble lytic murein transglycosylase-like protein
MDGIRFADRLAQAGQPVRVPTSRREATQAPSLTADQFQSRTVTQAQGLSLWQRLQNLGQQVTSVFRPQAAGKATDWHQAGDQIAQIGARAGYPRGAIIRDPAVINAMLDEAARIYGVPAHWLHRLAQRESSGNHWSANGQVYEAAAIGLLQIEKTAYPELVAGGPVQARHNAYDLANNIAIGAMHLRQQYDRIVKASGYTGNNAWRDIGPLVEFTYSAGSGALKSAQAIARERGLNPWNWQHLLLGHDWQVPTSSQVSLPRGWITNSPMATAIQRIHDQRAQQPGRANYPVAWTDAGSVRRFDFDGDGQAHKVERMLARTMDMVLGYPDPRPAR